MNTLVDWLTERGAWLVDHAALTTVMLAVSLVVLVGSLWICRYVLITIPPDYFNRPHKHFEHWRTARPALWWSVMIGKNAIGALLIVTGLIMFFTPGQGILTLLFGISLVDFPGKHALLLKLVRRPSVLMLINRLRARADRAPLEIIPGPEGEKAS
jgi:Putative transmembrane protein (PGPGW)